jgi:hypothetical protein
MAVDRAVNKRKRLVSGGGAPIVSSKVVAKEMGIALTYWGSTYAVMMATPSRLGEDPRAEDQEALWPTTIRGHDQYNTTLYCLTDIAAFMASVTSSFSTSMK